jgi:hypothetical protein
LAEGKGGDLLWQFRHCGFGIGEWKIKTDGPFRGSGVGTIDDNLRGTFYIDELTPEADIRLEYSGDIKLTTKPLDGADEPQPDRLIVETRQGTVTTEIGVFSREVSAGGQTFAVKRTDMPCRNADE